MRAHRLPPHDRRPAPRAAVSSGWRAASGPKRNGTRSAPTPHLAVAAGAVGAASGMEPEHTALSVVYTTMTGSATAAQRLLALDPGDVAALTFELSALCEQTAARGRQGACRPVRPAARRAGPAAQPNANVPCSPPERDTMPPHFLDGEPHGHTRSAQAGAADRVSRCASASADRSAPARPRSWPRCAGNYATSCRWRC